jgi:hypothetical protein
MLQQPPALSPCPSPEIELADARKVGNRVPVWFLAVLLNIRNGICRKPQLHSPETVAILPEASGQTIDWRSSITSVVRCALLCCTGSYLWRPFRTRRRRDFLCQSHCLRFVWVSLCPLSSDAPVAWSHQVFYRLRSSDTNPSCFRRVLPLFSSEPFSAIPERNPASVFICKDCERRRNATCRREKTTHCQASSQWPGRERGSTAKNVSLVTCWRAFGQRRD